MADTLDIVSLTEAKDAVNMVGAGTSNDSELARMVTAVSRRVDERCGPVVVRDVADELHDGGCGFIRPRLTPLYSVTALKEWDSAGASTSLTAETNASKPPAAYLLDRDDALARNVKLRRRASGSDSTFVSGRRNVELDYVAGRYATTGAVDARFKMAVGSILRRLWQREGGSWAVGGEAFGDDGQPSLGFFKAVDPMINEFLGDDIRVAAA